MRVLQHILSVAALCATPVLAASPTVGQPAPELGSTNWVANAPEVESVAALKGEVIFVEKWGVKCPPCVALIPHVEKLQQTYGKRGLHIFTFEAQNHTPDQILAKLDERGGKTYPVSAGGGNGYQGDGGIPVAWLIGVDGTVIWQGNPAAETSTLDRLIEEEVAKVRYPGMGKSEFHPDALKSVKAYMKQELGKARAEAQKVLANEKQSDAHADAQFLVDKVAEVWSKRWASFEADREGKRYAAALENLAWLSKAFKGEDEGTQAKDLLKELKKDKQVKRELAAAAKLQKLLAKLEGQPAEVRAKMLEKFLEDKKVEGTQAAEDARAAIH